VRAVEDSMTVGKAGLDWDCAGEGGGARVCVCRGCRLMLLLLLGVMRVSTGRP
jgi:hypothetical protein